MSTILLVRHIETKSNELGLFGDGPLDDIPSERGERQLKALEMLFAAHAGAGWTVWHGSKVRQELTARTHPAAARPPFSYRHHTGLNELGVGEWSGKSKTGEEISTEDLAAWRAGKITPPGGETDKQFETRVLNVWHTELRPRACDGQSLVVITSGNPIRLILGDVLRVEWRDFLPTLDIDNAGITTLRVGKGGKFFVANINDTSHLAGIGITKIAGT